MEKPIVSVIMPVYCGEKYICQAVDSVFAQDIPLELIVVVDASSDGTSRVLDLYRKRPDFVYVRNEQNMGAAASRNRGLLVYLHEHLSRTVDLSLHYKLFYHSEV